MKKMRKIMKKKMNKSSSSVEFKKTEISITISRNKTSYFFKLDTLTDVALTILGGEPGMEMDLWRRISGIGGTHLRLVMEKTLSATDVNPGNKRLSIPGRKMKAKVEEFLTPEEMAAVEERKEAIAVTVVDGNLSTYGGIELKRWKMTSVEVLNLTKAWNDVVRKYSLVKGTSIQLWAFRVRSELWFAIVKV